jgi:excisionase family DNA binding protein
VLVSGPAAVVSGWEATVLALALRDYQKRGGFARLPADQRRLVDAAIAEVEEAGRLSRAVSDMVRSGPEQSKPASVATVSHRALCASSELLTVTEAAGLLGVSVSTVRRVLGTGDLQAVRVGRSLRFKMSDLENFMETRRTA